MTLHPPLYQDPTRWPRQGVELQRCNHRAHCCDPPLTQPRKRREPSHLGWDSARQVALHLDQDEAAD
eukprot:1193031-Prorocentrum_minimum.AAC.1